MKLIKHLKERGMDTSLYNIERSYSGNIITFYLYNLIGQIVGYQQYRPLVKDKKSKNNPKLSRYFTYLPRGVIGLFGLETLDYNKKELFVVEGLFKAATLHRLGFNAVAVLGSSPKQERSLFWILSKRFNVIGIGDNDSGGKSLINCVGKGFVSPIDIDEMNDDDIKNMIFSFTKKKI